MTDTMIERVAAAMKAKRLELIAQPLERAWPELARAAIEAMREPSGGMIDAALNAWRRPALGDAQRADRAHTAAIDAALQETKG